MMEEEDIAHGVHLDALRGAEGGDEGVGKVLQELDRVVNDVGFAIEGRETDGQSTGYLGGVVICRERAVEVQER